MGRARARQYEIDNIDNAGRAWDITATVYTDPTGNPEAIEAGMVRGTGDDGSVLMAQFTAWQGGRSVSFYGDASKSVEILTEVNAFIDRVMTV